MAYSSYQKHYMVFAQLRNIMLNVSYIIPPFSLLVNILSHNPARNISDNLYHPAGNVQQHEPRGGLQGSLVLYSAWECDFLCY